MIAYLRFCRPDSEITGYLNFDISMTLAMAARPRFRAIASRSPRACTRRCLKQKFGDPARCSRLHGISGDGCQGDACVYRSRPWPRSRNHSCRSKKGANRPSPSALLSPSRETPEGLPSQKMASLPKLRNHLLAR